MKSNMRYYWIKILNFALCPSMARDEKERFRLLNVASFFWFSFAITLAIASLFYAEYLIFGISLTGAILTLIPPFLSYFDKKNYAKLSFLVVYTFACLAVPYFFGEESLFEWGMLIMPSSAFLLTNKLRPRGYFLLYGFLGVSAVFLIYHFTDPIIPHINIPMYGYLFTLAMGAFVFFMIATFKKELAVNMKIIIQQNKELSNNQSIIQTQNSELLLANQELDRQQLALEKLNKDLKQFASMASHDMKEPLRTISAFSKILSKKMDDDDNNKALFNFIEDAAKRMNTLLESLLQYAHAGMESEEREEVDLKEIFDKVKLNLFQSIEQKGARIQAENLPIMYGHPTMCFQLFQNLIGNSIKYCRADVTPCVMVQAQKLDHHIKITFQDNGIGISEADAELVFKPFTRLHSAAEYEGSGIGLATCQRIVENYGGEIYLKSELGVGTCFTILFPKEIMINPKESEDLDNSRGAKIDLLNHIPLTEKEKRNALHSV